MTVKEKVERKLAAIMFTDIVGYTAISARDSQKALQLLDDQNKTLKPILEKYRGNLLKEMGDGLLITFESATSAVECAIEIQNQTKIIENLNLRIGIHEGEVTIKDGDVFGDDVNIASRIEPFSAIGGVAVSDKIQRAISSNQEFDTDYIGKPKLKGVKQAVEVYCITSHQLPKTELSKVSAKLEKEKSKFNIFSLTGSVLTIIGLAFWLYISAFDVSFADENKVPAIAILPFENKGAPQDEFYVYGISSDLIKDVAVAGMIRVASLKDIEKLQYQKMETSDLAQKLFVRYVAQGTLWKLDTLFQLSMEIYDTQQSKIIYTNRWQTDWKNLTSIKGILSENILNTLEIEVNQDKREHIVSINPEAYELYLKAKYKFSKRETFEDIELARGLLSKSIELDNKLLSAKILLGYTYEKMGELNKALEFYTSTLIQAEKVNDKLSLGICLFNNGNIYRLKGNYDKSLEIFERALTIFKELNAKYNIADCIRKIGVVYESKDELEKSMEYYLKSYDLFKEIESRGGIAGALNSIGIGYSLQGEYEKAIEYYKRAIPIVQEIGIKPFLGKLLSNTAYEYKAMGKHNFSIEYYNQALNIFRDLKNKNMIGHVLVNIAGVYKKMGDYEKPLELYQEALINFEALQDSTGIASTIVSIGYNYCEKGNYDKAFDYFFNGLSLRKEIGFNHLIINSLNSIGYLYFSMGDFENAVYYYEKSIKLSKEDKKEKYKQDFYIMSRLFESYKGLGDQYDENEILLLLKEENIEDFSYEFSFVLYKLLEDQTFLESAHKSVREKSKWLDNDKFNKFINYPIPKQIIELYNKTLS